MSATVEVHLRKRYQCSVCGKSWSSASRCHAHINSGCIKDPDAHACPTCIHQGLTEFEGYYCSLGLLDRDGNSRTVAADGFEDDGDFERKTFIKNCPEWRGREIGESDVR